jgi:hypothetical protein
MHSTSQKTCNGQDLHQLAKLETAGAEKDGLHEHSDRMTVLWAKMNKSRHER